MPLVDASLDHVAVAVDDIDAALERWYDLGAVAVGGGINGFRSEQVRLSNGAKVELISTAPGHSPGFIGAFLDRFGTGVIHHVTIKVKDSIHTAVATLAADGVETVDLNDSYTFWHEAFVRPSVVGGLVAQVAWSDGDDATWARRSGRPEPPAPNPDAPAVQAVVLSHTDPVASAGLWATLGATIHTDAPADDFVARWPDSPLAIRVERADTCGPRGLIVDGLSTGPSTTWRPTVVGPSA